MTNLPPVSSMRAESLMAFSSYLHEKYPGLQMRQNLHTYGVNLGFNVGVFVADEYVLSAKDAVGLLDSAIERLQMESIYQLGLTPRIDAYEKTIRTLREDNVTLRGTIQRRDSTIVRLQEQIDQLTHVKDTDRD